MEPLTLYVTDYRKKTNQAKDSDESKKMEENLTKETVTFVRDLENEIQVIDADIKELELQIFHLVRSNEELMEEIKVDPDPIYKEAIRENLDVIIKKKERISELEELREQLQSSSQSPTEEDRIPMETERVDTQNKGDTPMTVDQLTFIVNNTRLQQRNEEDKTSSPPEDEEGIFL